MAQVPHPWQMGLQAPHSSVQAEVQSLNTFVLYIIIAITVFVAGLLLYVIVKLQSQGGIPIPSRTSHNTVIEILWTTVPVLDPDRDRGAVVPAGVFPGQDDQARHDRQGDRVTSGTGSTPTRSRVGWISRAT